MNQLIESQRSGPKLFSKQSRLYDMCMYNVCIKNYICNDLEMKVTMEDICDFRQEDLADDFKDIVEETVRDEVHALPT